MYIPALGGYFNMSVFFLIFLPSFFFFLSLHIRKKFHCSVDIRVSYFLFILARGEVTGKYIHT